jgi:hypothetical protein
MGAGEVKGAALEYAALPVALHQVPVLNLTVLNGIPGGKGMGEGGGWGGAMRRAALVAVVLRRLQRFVPDEKVEIVDAACGGGEDERAELSSLRKHAPFLVATEPVDAEPTLSSTAMQEGMTKEGSGLPDKCEWLASGRQMNRARVQLPCLHIPAWCSPFHCP